MGQLSVLIKSMSKSHKRNVLYCCFVQMEYDVLGRRRRVCILVCVVRFICLICPSNDSQLTGHHDAEGEGGDDDNIEEDNDAVNNSFHEIEEEASP